MSGASHDLAIRGESIQRLYNLYVSDAFQVNRKYQRKLVWTVEEKQRLIDSVQRDLPLPLVLVAELHASSSRKFELIDGLQRMNAIMAFLENEYSVDGEYFNLESLADTKLLLDEGRLTQKTPVMSRARSSEIANYTVALSVFKASSQTDVEEIFRRINSGGRRLSRHALRQAGAVSELADIVRTVASRIRGDTSPGDVVPLVKMPHLSITNQGLPYGVDVERIFWVENLILRREDIRESFDEQLLLDLIVDCIIEPLGASTNRGRDAFYNYSSAILEDESQESVSAQMAIEAYGADVIIERIMAVYDVLREIVDLSGKRFGNLVGVDSGGRSPRYYHVVFVAVFELMFRDGRRLSDADGAAKALAGTSRGRLSIPGGGGDFAAGVKRQLINSAKGLLMDMFEPAGDGEDMAQFGLASKLETILSNSLVEQQLVECKQGIVSLDPRDRRLDSRLVKKLSRTLCAMNNVGPGSTGYLLVGIADDDASAEMIRSFDTVSAINYRGFPIVGIEREARFLEISINDYWTRLVQKVASGIEHQGLSHRIRSSARLVSYRGMMVGLFSVSSVDVPVFCDGLLYDRLGSETTKIPNDRYMEVFGRFSASATR